MTNTSFPKLSNLTSNRPGSPIQNMLSHIELSMSQPNMQKFGPMPHFSLTKLGPAKYKHIKIPDEAKSFSSNANSFAHKTAFKEHLKQCVTNGPKISKIYF